MLYLGGGVSDIVQRCGAVAVFSSCKAARKVNALEDASQWRCETCGGLFSFCSSCKQMIFGVVGMYD